MAAINDLIAQVNDPALRDKLEAEVKKLSKQKKFGLVFEEHLPECTPLYDMPITKNCNVMLKESKEDKTIYFVLKVENNIAYCISKSDNNIKAEFSINDIVRVAEFGEPIYPYLKPIDSVCNAPDSDLWHTLIEADNYHALQLLEYLYAGKVDCIYIDPPYNTGAKDWKYNNDYVDGNDAYRHSKWLSMMQKRLILAKKLLNPNSSVMIVAIDEKEFLRLGCLLEEVFPEAKIQMISICNSQKGIIRANEFTRTNEYLFFVMIGNYVLQPVEKTNYVKEGDSIHWQTFRRSDITSKRGTKKGGTAQFYPIYVNNETFHIEFIGEPLPHDVDRNTVKKIDGCTAVFPIREDGTEMNWGVKFDEARVKANKGYIRANKYEPNKPQKYVIQYLMGGTIEDIDKGKIVVTGYEKNGSVIAYNLETKLTFPKTQWDNKAHDSRDNGSKILKAIFCNEMRFDFPKSLYAVLDSLDCFIKDNKNALVVDFFAGSGTTLHAINLMNARDNGTRRCIMVTNNEVSEKESESLIKRGFCPNDKEWEYYGVAHYITWPRTKCSILGIDISENRLNGNYGSEIETYVPTDSLFGKNLYTKETKQLYPELSNIKFSDGFKANAAFFKLGFLDKTAVALGMQFKEMLPTLWMKAGMYGPCPSIEGNIPDMMILPENKFAVLIDENSFSKFEDELKDKHEINTVYIVTDYEVNYRSMVKNLNVENTYQLYRDYLDNFRINHGRS